MDRETLLGHRQLWVQEEDDKRFEGILENLTDVEQKLYTMIKDNILGERVRLEQERLPFAYVRSRLQTITNC